MINDDKADEIFNALQTIRDFLPEAAAVAEIAFPAATPFVELGESVLSKVFELVVSMRHTDNPEAAAAALRSRTIIAVEAALAASAVYPK